MIDWCLTPTLAVFQQLFGVKPKYEIFVHFTIYFKTLLKMETKGMKIHEI